MSGFQTVQAIIDPVALQKASAIYRRHAYLQEIEYVHQDDINLEASADEEDIEDTDNVDEASSSSDEQGEGLPGSSIEAYSIPSRTQTLAKRKAGRPFLKSLQLAI